MAYGRLEIFWPDGRLETYLLETDTVSVGRAEGNTISLDTDAISRYHFSIVKEGDDISITDLASANGTFVDGVQLESNQPLVLGDVEEIQIGSLRVLFRKVDDAPTLAIEAQDGEVTQRIEHDPAVIRMELDYAHLEVWPAASSSSELSITNIGSQTQRFSVRVSGMPGEWLRLTRPELELDPGETAYVLVNIKPPRRPNTVPTQYQVTVEVAPVDDPDLAVQALIDVDVKAYSGFGIAMVPQLEPGDPVSVFLHNQGSGSLTLTLTAIDPQHTLDFTLPAAPLTLQPGQRLRVDVGLQARNPALMGAASKHEIIIQAQSHDSSGFIAATSGKVQMPPRYPLWAVLSGAGLVLAVILVILVAIMGFFRIPQPEITSVSVNAAQLAQGDDLIIVVNADNVDTFDVLVNEMVVLSNQAGDESQFTIDTTNLSGQLNIDVIGRNRAGDTQATTTSYVYIPMAVAKFITQPDWLVRYAVGTFTVEWEVPGAAFVRISGLGEFTNQRLQASTEYQAVDKIENISGIPGDSLTITLYAEDEVGHALEETLPVRLIDPECTALENIPLREGPNERFQQVGNVPQNTVVVVTAQDAEAGWLRVQLPGDVRGWGERDTFNCAKTFNLADLYTEFNLPELPPASPTPTTPPIPQATPTASGG